MEGSIFSTLTSNELGIFFTGLGVALSAILSGIGSAIGVGKAGQAAAGEVGANERILLIPAQGRDPESRQKQALQQLA